VRAEILTVVLLKAGPYAGKTATIVEIIDHNRVRPIVIVICPARDLFISLSYRP
jgi:ribosomal protein L14E/L6E/L27E